MKVTVCAFPAGPTGLESAWNALGEHVRSEGSDLVLLPEMPFSRWLAARETVDPSAGRRPSRITSVGPAA